jgi:hypothetical protein
MSDICVELSLCIRESFLAPLAMKRTLRISEVRNQIFRIETLLAWGTQQLIINIFCRKDSLYERCFILTQVLTLGKTVWNTGESERSLRKCAIPEITRQVPLLPSDKIAKSCQHRSKNPIQKARHDVYSNITDDVGRAGTRFESDSSRIERYHQ